LLFFQLCKSLIVPGLQGIDLDGRAYTPFIFAQKDYCWYKKRVSLSSTTISNFSNFNGVNEGKYFWVPVDADGNVALPTQRPNVNIPNVLPTTPFLELSFNATKFVSIQV